ncbi:helix-turn-helix domain-containing protein [Glycomyces xiaoerkulensis]|uniref:helix-turn-helix domain-containing protein n=1 Tax=Glycomyces xiaoerkulensis TaxID=2038139 RepID=UPI000C268249|nr:helix-turn-helix domain-containing protein [Glycomyces xiaoerkulensis]
MRSSAGERADPAEWDVATPGRPGRVPGVGMAGFGVRRLTGLRMIPHPAVTLVLEFGAGRPVVDEAAGRRQCGNLVAGLGSGFGGTVRVHGEHIECVQVRLSPPLARAVLGTDPGDLDGATVALDDLWGREARRISEQLAESSSWEDRFALVEAVLARRGQGRHPVEPEAALAWNRIVHSRGRVRVDRLAAEIGWSRKRLWSRFRTQIGLSPKQAAKLARFDHAAHRLVAGEAAAWVAFESGYSDQSHLQREVKAFTGATPAALSGAPWLTVDDVAWPRHEVPA